MQVKDVMAEIMKDLRYYKQSGGGLTISGGEPLAQFDFTLELLRLAKENDLHTCMETSGHAPTERILALLPYVDLFLFDFKDSNDNMHRKYTGVSNRQIIDNLRTIDVAGAKIILRCPIIPTCNNRGDHFSAISAIANSLQNIVEVNIMPYHPMGASKATRVGLTYLIEDIGFPTDEEVAGWLQAVSCNTAVAVMKG